MSGVFDGLEPEIQKHLETIRSDSGLPEGDASLELLAEGWLEKGRAFDDQVASMSMEVADENDDPARGFLALTYSGSLVAVGPDEPSGRRAVYVSIDRRRDVPARAEADDASIHGEVSRGREIVFAEGPVRKTSAIYRLALLPTALPLEDQRSRLEEATVALTKEFKAVDETRIDEG